MYEEKAFEIVIPENKEKERLDKFLTRHLGNVSRARLQKLIDAGQVMVDGRPAKSSHLVMPAEKIEFTIPRPQKVDIEPENIPLEILYEDPHLLVLNKKAGMVVHPAFSNYSGTLVHALLYHCGDLSSIGGRQRPGIVHRLDKDTSGVMVVAKDDITHQHLSRQFADKTTERKYWAIVWGKLKKKKGKIETYIARSPKDRKKMSVQTSGKWAITNYERLEVHKIHSLIELKLETGRTHQIRVHLSYLGHPVFGDMEYGGRNRQLGGLSNNDRRFASELLSTMQRQALHARELGFVHPIKNELLHFNTELPEDMKLLLEQIRSDGV